MGTYTIKKMSFERDKIIEGIKRIKASDEYGLCFKCESFCIRRSKLGSEEVWCDRYETNAKMIIRPSKIDPVENCSYYWPKGQMSLEDMKGIAHIIDYNKKIRPGFDSNGSSEIIEVTIKPPTDDDREDSFYLR